MNLLLLWIFNDIQKLNFIPQAVHEIMQFKEWDIFKKKRFPFWQKCDIGVFTYIWTAQSLT